MDFLGTLSENAEGRVKGSDELLTDPRRLAALRHTDLIDSPPEIEFDRLAELAAKLLGVPLTIVSLVSDRKQFFKASYGMPAPYDVIREIPINGSICRYTLAGEAIIAADSAQDPLLKWHPATIPWGIAAFIAIPMKTRDGHVLGAFCAVDTKPRVWSEKDLLVMNELTESIMTEIQLRGEVKKLEGERDLREQFVATLTHDLRTPLGVAKMSAELLSDNMSDEHERSQLIKMITSNMDRADQMILDLLNVSQMKAGELVHINLADCDLNDVVRSTLDSLSKLHGTRFAFKSEGLISGVWDALAIRRIVENLAGNAVKYGSPLTPITVSLGLTKDFAEIAIHNHGNAIDSANLKTIFDPYKRSQDALEGNKKGWGIGLTLVRGFAEAHGGSVSVESSANHGTTFTVRLPRDNRLNS